MGRIIITYNEVAELNDFLESNGISYKVHMHDLCGSQSFTLKPLDSSEVNEPEAVTEKIREYFSRKSLIPKFSENSMEFTVY